MSWNILDKWKTYLIYPDHPTSTALWKWDDLGMHHPALWKWKGLGMRYVFRPGIDNSIVTPRA